MNIGSVWIFPSIFAIFLLSSQNAVAFNPIKRFLHSIKKQLKEKVPTRNNAFDDSVVYAVPTYDGQGFILHGYGKPFDPYAYDKDVDIYQIPKMWNGKVTIPNVFGDFTSGYEHEYDKTRVVKGSDNRLGFRLAIPYIGDFQYLREIGPGRFTDNLGPGAFEYPGFKDKLNNKKHHHHHQYPPHHPPPHESSYTHISDSSAGYNTGGHHSVGDPYLTSASANDGVYAHDDLASKGSEKTTPDPFEGLRNYPWHTR